MKHDTNWWVEVLLDDGEQWGYAATTEYASQAGKEALETAIERSLKPVEVVSVTNNDTDETVYERGVSGDWRPDYEVPLNRVLSSGKVKDTHTGEAHDPYSHVPETNPHDPGHAWWHKGRFE